MSVVYTGRSARESVESDLAADMLAVVTSLAGRLYGRRSAEAGRLRVVVAEAGGGGGR